MKPTRSLHYVALAFLALLMAPYTASSQVNCSDCHETTGCQTVTKNQGTCESCHLDTSDADDFGMNFVTAKISTGQWQSSGHGKTGLALACEYCHDYNIDHGVPTNPFRLRNTGAGGPLGQNTNCWACHGTASAGVDPDGAGTDFSLRNSVVKANSYHAGYKHDAPEDGGNFCWDCHDPHGDTNIFMVHTNVSLRTDGLYGIPAETRSVTFTNNQRPSDFVHNLTGPPFDGVCQVCHFDTKHCKAPCFDGHDSGPVCTDCHTHDGDFLNDGWRPNCNACHGYPPVVDVPQGIDGLAKSPSPTGAPNAGAHQVHAVDYAFSCYACHFNGMPTTPVGSDYHIQMGFDVFGFNGSGSRYIGQTLNPAYSYSGTNGTVIASTGTPTTCSNFYCHSDGTAVSTRLYNPGNTNPANFPGSNQSSPPWDGATSCNSCHSYPPNYACNSPKSNQHPRHADLGYTCNMCHVTTTANSTSITDRKKHVNGQYDVAPDTNAYVNFGAVSTNVNFTYTYDPGGGTCSNISCHSAVGTSATLRWCVTNLIAGVSWSPGSTCGSVNFAINVTGSYPSGSATPPYYYYIDWENDGVWDYEGPNASHTHTYPQSGQNYTIRYTVRDSMMRTLDGTGTRQLQVTPATGSSNVNPVPGVDRTNIVYTPVYGNPSLPTKITSYDVTITDRSTDADFNACGRSGTGYARINWGDGNQEIGLPLNLTNTPSNQTFTHRYFLGGRKYVQWYVRDNAGSSYVQLSPNIQVDVPNF